MALSSAGSAGSVDDLVDSSVDGHIAEKEFRRKATLKGRLWSAAKKPIRCLCIVGAIGGTGLYLGVSNSENIRSAVYEAKKSIALSRAPKYDELLKDFRKANSLYDSYDEKQRSGEGRDMFCKELVSAGYLCRKAEAEKPEKQESPGTLKKIRDYFSKLGGVF
jgi:hypothetical protein